MDSKNVLVVGQGEIGFPLASILENRFSVYRKDLEPLIVDVPIDVLHVCYPYSENNFVDITVSYIAEYTPDLVIVHSTVVPGTTREIHEKSGTNIVYSAVRGKHTRMEADLISLPKFVAGLDDESTDQAVVHLNQIGMKTEVISRPEALELAKLLETSYFGMLLAWSQEMDRYCSMVGADYYESMKFMSDVGYLPPVVFQPGFIGGHCVVPNSHLLDKLKPSAFMQLMRDSNDLLEAEWVQQGRDLNERLAPIDNEQSS